MSGFEVAAGGDTSVPDGATYRDRHETSLTLLLLGAVISACALLAMAWLGGGEVAARLPTAAAVTIAFGVLWLTFRRRAARHGMRPSPGFGIAAILCVAALVPPFVLALVYAGPFLVFSAGLLAAGIRLRNRFLATWATAIGAIGIFEGFFGITNRLPGSVWAEWEHSAIYLSLGLLTILAGIIMRARGEPREPVRARLAALAFLP